MMRDTDVAVGDIVRSGKDRQHARLAARRRGVDRDDVGVGVRRAHEHRERLPLDRHVVGVAALPAHEPQILEARQGSADETGPRPRPSPALDPRRALDRLDSRFPLPPLIGVSPENRWRNLSKPARHCQLAAPAG